MKYIVSLSCIIYRKGSEFMEPIITLVTIVTAAVSLLTTADVPSAAGNAVTADTSVMCPMPADGTANGDVFALHKPHGFYSASSDYGKVAEATEWDVSDTIYFRALKPGKDNITVTVVNADGTFGYTEYVIQIDDDLKISVIDIISSNPPILY